WGRGRDRRVVLALAAALGRGVRAPAALHRLVRPVHPSARPDSRGGAGFGAGAGGTRRWLGTRNGAHQRALRTTRATVSPPQGDAEGAAADGARPRHGDVRLFPHTRRRRAGDAGSGRRCHHHVPTPLWTSGGEPCAL